MNGPGPVAGGRAPADTDLDGMPDYWEIAAGLDPNIADHNGDADGNGYTNLEDYLNSLVKGGVQQGAITGVTDDTGLSTPTPSRPMNVDVSGGLAPAPTCR